MREPKYRQARWNEQKKKKKKNETNSKNRHSKFIVYMEKKANNNR